MERHEHERNGRIAGNASGFSLTTTKRLLAHDAHVAVTGRMKATLEARHG